jgi:hypothetical protein
MTLSQISNARGTKIKLCEGVIQLAIKIRQGFKIGYGLFDPGGSRGL